MNPRSRQLTPVALVLAVSVAGFFGARAIADRDAQRASSQRAELAAARVRDRIDQAANVVDGIRRFLVGQTQAGGQPAEFADIGARWLAPLGLPAAGWIESVPGPERGAYERRRRIALVSLAPSGGAVPDPRRRRYLPATLVTRAPPLTTAGLDLEGVPGVAAAVARPETGYSISATPLVNLADGSTGLFLVQSAQRLAGGVVEPGFATVFVPASWLLASADDTASATQDLRLTVGGVSTGRRSGGPTVHDDLVTAGQQFEVSVPLDGVHGAAAVLPWIILGAGLVLAALAGALGINAARRARSKAEVDRLFVLSPDLIVVLGFDGYFRRTNPAFETTLGYTEREALARPLAAFVHPDDWEATEAELRRIKTGATTISFENRYVCKDGSHRWIEWTAAPVPEEGAIYGVGRDVTERREAERELSAAEERYRTLAEAQAALRRIATLVAHRASPVEVFTAAAVETSRLLESDSAALARYETDGTATILALEGLSDDEVRVGLRVSLEGESAMANVLRTRDVAWAESFGDATGPVAELARRLGIRSSVGAPIVVEGRVWGVIVATSTGERLAAGAEQRLADFTELVATGIADAESRAALACLAEEQAALRRVATLVAEGVPPAEVFSSLADEVSRLLEAEGAVIARLEPDGTLCVVASGGSGSAAVEVGRRLDPKPGLVVTAVLRTGRPAREADSTDNSVVPGFVDRVGVPIVVEGALWGVIVTWTTKDRFREGTEQRMTEFTALAATAIANAEGRSELAASRARIVTAGDEVRRRIERDLHDGTQQRLVSLALHLRVAHAALPAHLEEARRTLTRVADELEAAFVELSELARGIHPADLDGGLERALRSLARRSAIRVKLAVRAEPHLPDPIKVATYYVVSEALTNAAKHAQASQLDVVVDDRDGVLHLSIRDDGVGGADSTRGTGLIGLRDRVEALGGSITVSSPLGEGTHIVVEFPLEGEPAHDGWRPARRDDRGDRLAAARQTPRP